MQFQEMFARMALEQIKRDRLAREMYERRFNWMRHMRRPGSRAHRKWAQARASGRC